MNKTAAFDAGVATAFEKTALSPELKARAAQAVRRRLKTLSEAGEGAMSRGARRELEASGERLRRKLPALEGLGPTQHTAKKRIENISLEHAKTRVDAPKPQPKPQPQPTRIERDPAFANTRREEVSRIKERADAGSPKTDAGSPKPGAKPQPAPANGDKKRMRWAMPAAVGVGGVGIGYGGAHSQRQ